MMTLAPTTPPIPPAALNDALALLRMALDPVATRDRLEAIAAAQAAVDAGVAELRALEPDLTAREATVAERVAFCEQQKEQLRKRADAVARQEAVVADAGKAAFDRIGERERAVEAREVAVAEREAAIATRTAALRESLGG